MELLHRSGILSDDMNVQVRPPLLRQPHHQRQDVEGSGVGAAQPERATGGPHGRQLLTRGTAYDE